MSGFAGVGIEHFQPQPGGLMVEVQEEVTGELQQGEK
jgi:hypothetical protein